MVRVMAQGVFDILHLGHLHYLVEAKRLGDELVVVVARDSTVRKLKHEPVTPEEMRREMIEAMKPVDQAVLGDETDRYVTVEKVKPDIIAIGYDQEVDEEKLNKDLAERDMGHIKVVRLPKFDDDLNGTRKIISKIIGYWGYQKKLEEVEEPLKFHPRKEE
jgi:FAD synthetase